MKHYLALKAGGEASGGTLNTLAYHNGAMRLFQLDWRVAAREAVTVEAGTFECAKMGIQPRTWYLRLLGGESFLWVDAAGDPKIVRTPVRRGVFSKEKIMELTRHESIPCGDPDLQDPAGR